MDLIGTIVTYWPKLLSGLWTTVSLAGLGALFAGIFAPLLALVRLNGPAWAQIPLRIYVSFMRGTPLLAQMFLIYYGSGQFRPFFQSIGLWWFFRDPFNCALLAFVLNSTAYQTEILRGGLMGVPHGEIEAGKAIGMSWLMSLRRIYLPARLPHRMAGARQRDRAAGQGERARERRHRVRPDGPDPGDLREDLRLLGLPLGGAALSLPDRDLRLDFCASAHDPKRTYAANAVS